MTPLWPKRPTCGQVLNTRREWIIDTNVVKEWTEFDSFAIKLNENKFFSKFLKQKINI